MLSHVRLFSIPWTEAHQDLQFMGFSRKNTGVGSHSLLWGIFLIQVSKLCLLYCLHWQTGSLPLSHLGSPLDKSEQWAKYINIYRYGYGWASLGVQLVKHPLAIQETLVQFLGQKDPLEKGYVTHSSILGLPRQLGQ